LNKLKQEKDENEKIRSNIEADRKRRFMLKQSTAQKAQIELNNHLAYKKQNEEIMQKEKINEKNFKGSWDINHEERLQKLKNYMNLLSEKVDLNMNKYIIYNNQHSNRSSGNIVNSKSNTNSPLSAANYNFNNYASLNGGNCGNAGFDVYNYNFYGNAAAIGNRNASTENSNYNMSGGGNNAAAAGGDYNFDALQHNSN